MAWWERWFEQRLNRLGSSLWMRKVVVVMMDISVGDWNVGGGGWVPMFCLWGKWGGWGVKKTIFFIF